MKPVSWNINSSVGASALPLGQSFYVVADDGLKGASTMALIAMVWSAAVDDYRV